MASLSTSTPPRQPSQSAGWSNMGNSSDSLKYYATPSQGLRPNDSAAGVAASLGWANRAKPLPSRVQAEAGTGNTSSSQDALAAATLSQRPPQQTLRPSSSSGSWVSAAATRAFQGNKVVNPTVPSSNATGVARKSSTRAAQDAMAGVKLRAQSLTMEPPSEQKVRLQQEPASTITGGGGGTALSAAALAHRPSVRASTTVTTNIGPATTAPFSDVGSVPYTTLDRQMFTSSPPVQPEVDEKRHSDVIHASALAMARRMYSPHEDPATIATAADRPRTILPFSDAVVDGTSDDASTVPTSPVTAIYGSNLQEAAYRLAQDRLAKLQGELDAQRRMSGSPHANLQKYFHSFYYYDLADDPLLSPDQQQRQQQNPRRWSLKGKFSSNQLRQQQEEQQQRRRAVSDGALVEEGRRKKEALLAVAQRNVMQQMKEIDQNVQQQKQQQPSPERAKVEWSKRALALAQARVAAANAQTGDAAGKVDIGGGMLVDRAEVDRIAFQRVKPVLDEIHEQAAKEKERREEEERMKEVEKRRELEVKETFKQLKVQQKQDEKARKAEIKQHEKELKDEAKALKAEKKKAAKAKEEEEKQAAKAKVEEEQKADQTSPTPLPAPSSPTTILRTPTTPTPKRTSTTTFTRHVRSFSLPFGSKHKPKTEKHQPTPQSAPANPTAAEQTTTANEPTTPTSPTRKVRAWFLSHLPGRSSHSGTSPKSSDKGKVKAATSEDQPKTPPTPTKRSFIGGAALAKLRGAEPVAATAPKEVADEDAKPSGGKAGRYRAVWKGRGKGVKAGLFSSTANTGTTSAGGEDGVGGADGAGQTSPSPDEQSIRAVALAGREAPPAAAADPNAPPTTDAANDNNNHHRHHDDPVETSTSPGGIAETPNPLLARLTTLRSSEPSAAAAAAASGSDNISLSGASAPVSGVLSPVSSPSSSSASSSTATATAVPAPASAPSPLPSPLPSPSPLASEMMASPWASPGEVVEGERFFEARSSPWVEEATSPASASDGGGGPSLGGGGGGNTMPGSRAGSPVLVAGGVQKGGLSGRVSPGGRTSRFSEVFLDDD